MVAITTTTTHQREDHLRSVSGQQPKGEEREGSVASHVLFILRLPAAAVATELPQSSNKKVKILDQRLKCHDCYTKKAEQASVHCQTINAASHVTQCYNAWQWL